MAKNWKNSRQSKEQVDGVNLLNFIDYKSGRNVNINREVIKWWALPWY